MFQGYDVHMIIKALAKHEDLMSNIEIIPNSMEKYVSVKTRKFRSVFRICYGIKLNFYFIVRNIN